MNPLDRLPISAARFAVPTFVLLFMLFQQSFASTISGFVYSKHNRAPIPQVDVELLNENYQLRGRSKTDGVGRYTFSEVPDGFFTVRVLPFAFDLEDQEASIEVRTLSIRGSGQGNGYYTQDFYLMPKRGSLAAAETGVVFAQEVPDTAKHLYTTAVDDLSKARRAEGIRGLRDAIAQFPQYYDATHRLGKELFVDKEYGEAVQLFMKASQINPKSATSLYYVGYALHNLGPQYNKGAAVALNAALELAPASIQVLYLLGKIERIVGDYPNAEKHLVQAKKQTKHGIPEIHSELAQLYGNNLKKYDAAASELEAYIKASKLTPEEEQRTRQVISGLRQKSKTAPSN
jgi:tetratricopeptide (TPR) repeat protein